MNRKRRNLLVYSTLVAVLGTAAVAGTAFANTLRQHASSSASGGVSIFEVGSSSVGSASGSGAGSVSGAASGSVGGSGSVSGSGGVGASGSVSGSFSGSRSLSGSTNTSGGVSGSTSGSMSGAASAHWATSDSTSGAASAQARAAFAQLNRDSTRLYQALTELNSYPHFGQAMQNASEAANNLQVLSKTLSKVTPSTSGMKTASSQLGQIASKLQADVHTISSIVKPGHNGMTGKAPNLTATQASDVRAAIADMRSQFGGLSSVESQLASLFYAVDKGKMPILPITHPPLPPFPIWPLLPAQGGSTSGSGSVGGTVHGSGSGSVGGTVHGSGSGSVSGSGNGSASGSVSGSANGNGNGSVTITTQSGSGSSSSSVTVHLPGLVNGPYQPLQTTQNLK